MSRFTFNRRNWLKVVADAFVKPLRQYAPAQHACTSGADELILAADYDMNFVEVSNPDSTVTAWLCDARETPVDGKGYWLPPKSKITFEKSVPLHGLRAMCDGNVTLGIVKG